MTFYYQLAVFVVSLLVSYLLAPKPPQQKPPAVGNEQAPTAQEGTPIPVVFGEVLVKNSNVVWYGDLRVDPIMSSGGGK
ncbi:MAG: hypothetical protein KGJ74_03550 [Betaproteobacteria bacterium]|nr:hypothetical protein [Betaproteobacteria bacterium]